MKITIYAQVGDSEILNAIGAVEVSPEVRPVTDEDRAAGAAVEAEAMIDIDLAEVLRQTLAGFDPATALLPVPASDLKGFDETLCRVQTLIGQIAHPDVMRALADSMRLNTLIREIRQHRPIGVDGKHGDNHTPTCGCDVTEQEERRCGQQHHAVDHGSPCVITGDHSTHFTANGFWWTS